MAADGDALLYLAPAFDEVVSGLAILVVPLI